MQRPLSFAAAARDAVTNRLSTAHIDTGTRLCATSAVLSVSKKTRLTPNPRSRSCKRQRDPASRHCRPCSDCCRSPEAGGTLSGSLHRRNSAVPATAAGLRAKNGFADREKRVSWGVVVTVIAAGGLSLRGSPMDAGCRTARSERTQGGPRLYVGCRSGRVDRPSRNHEGRGARSLGIRRRRSAKAGPPGP